MNRSQAIDLFQALHSLLPVYSPARQKACKPEEREEIFKIKNN
jgi:hypothetical protein